jgi:hypothetical protein
MLRKFRCWKRVESGHLADRERDDILTLLWIVGKYIERVGGSGVGRFFWRQGE